MDLVPVDDSEFIWYGLRDDIRFLDMLHHLSLIDIIMPLILQKF